MMYSANACDGCGLWIISAINGTHGRTRQFSYYGGCYAVLVVRVSFFLKFLLHFLDRQFDLWFSLSHCPDGHLSGNHLCLSSLLLCQKRFELVFPFAASSLSFLLFPFTGVMTAMFCITLSNQWNSVLAIFLIFPFFDGKLQRGIGQLE